MTVGMGLLRRRRKSPALPTVLIILVGAPTTKPSVQSEGSPQAEQEQDPVEQQPTPVCISFPTPGALVVNCVPKMQWQNETEERSRANVTESPAPLSKDSAHAVLLAGTGNSTGFLISPLPFAMLLKLVVSLLAWLD